MGGQDRRPLTSATRSSVCPEEPLRGQAGRQPLPAAGRSPTQLTCPAKGQRWGPVGCGSQPTPWSVWQPCLAPGTPSGDVAPTPPACLLPALPSCQEAQGQVCMGGGPPPSPGLLQHCVLTPLPKPGCPPGQLFLPRGLGTPPGSGYRVLGCPERKCSPRAPSTQNSAECSRKSPRQGVVTSTPWSPDKGHLGPQARPFQRRSGLKASVSLSLPPLLWFRLLRCSPHVELRLCG